MRTLYWLAVAAGAALLVLAALGTALIIIVNTI